MQPGNGWAYKLSLRGAFELPARCSSQYEQHTEGTEPLPCQAGREKYSTLCFAIINSLQHLKGKCENDSVYSLFKADLWILVTEVLLL